MQEKANRYCAVTEELVEDPLFPDFVERRM